MNSSPLRRILCLALATFGLAISSYLLVRTFWLLEDQQTELLDICSTIFGSNCDATLTNPDSWTLSIPLAGWGVVYYGAVICLLGMGWALRNTFGQEASAGAMMLALIGLAGSIALTFEMVSGSDPYCPLCMAVHAINLTLVGAIAWLDGRSPRALGNAVLGGARYVLGADAQQPELAPWKLVGFLTPVLIAVVLFQWVLIQTERRAQEVDEGFNVEAILTAYMDSPVLEIPIREDDPRLGSADAPIQLVVFSDFECPACEGLEYDLLHVREELGDSISIVFKHYPLGADCNAGMSFDMHPMACNAARASEAAREQGLFWPLHDLLFGSVLDRGLAQIQELAEAAGLDLAQYEASMQAGIGRARVEADVELGDKLGIQGTPTVYINGKELQIANSQVIEVIAEQLLTQN